MRLAFMGTPDFAVPTLKALVAAGHEIVAVYTQPPSLAGRGRKLRPSQVAEAAHELGLNVFCPKKFKEPDVLDAFGALNLDAAIVVAYGQILPQAALDMPKYGCLNIHASLLPRWRGAAPIHRAILAGDKETGVCIMQMEAGLDTGPVYMLGRDTILDTDSVADVHDRLSHRGARLIVETLKGLEAGQLTAVPQALDGVTYARKIEKSEGRIDWTEPAESISRLVRGLYPFPGAWCQSDGARLKILNVRLADFSEIIPSIEASGTEPAVAMLPGEIRLSYDGQPFAACGEGYLELMTVQKAGKPKVSGADFIRGLKRPAGSQKTGTRPLYNPVYKLD